MRERSKFFAILLASSLAFASCTPSMAAPKRTSHEISQVSAPAFTVSADQVIPVINTAVIDLNFQVAEKAPVVMVPGLYATRTKVYFTVKRLNTRLSAGWPRRYINPPSNTTS